MKLLILSPDSFSVFHPETSYIFGGIEVECGHHARGLSDLGAEVHVLTRDHDVVSHTVGKVHLHPLTELKGKGYWNSRNTLGGRLRFRVSGDRNKETLEQWCSSIQPDCCYVMGVSPEALKLARFAKQNGKRFVFRAAHDRDLGDETFSDAGFREWARMPKEDVIELITGADEVIAQTPVQAELLLQRFGRTSHLMFPPIALEKLQESKKEFDVLWVGRTNSFKRPEQLLQLAARLPQHTFCMVLNRVSDAEWNAIDRQKTPNITIVESVPADKMETMFRKSRLYISTSLHEGFPNTFLQSAKNGIPILSMGSDPNAILTQHGAGFLVGDDQSALEERMLKLLTDAALYAQCAAAGRAYVETFNDSRKISEQLFQILQPRNAAAR